MARPVGDEWTARPEAASGKGCEPDPAPDIPADAANRAEDAARQAVERSAIRAIPGGVMRSPTNWIIASNAMVSVGARVELADGREGTIVRVAPTTGRPMVQIDDTDAQEAVHPSHIAKAI